MKNDKNIVDLYIESHLDEEYERIKSCSYEDIRHVPTLTSCCNEWKKLTTIAMDDCIGTKHYVNSPLIRRFHHSMCHANRKGCLSPYNGWEKIKSDKSLFEQLLRNRLTYNETFIRNGIPDVIPLYVYAQGMSVMRSYPMVSYFKPTLAKYLINKYLSDTNWIVDPFSGYSGRMLGALACNKNYVGSDICHSSIEESSELYSFISTEFNIDANAYLDYGDAREVCTDTFDALFTCPPYKDIEQWPSAEDGGVHSCEEWIDICIDNNKCDRYLFVVDDSIIKSEHYKKHIVEEIENRSHFGSNVEYVVLLT